MKNKEEIMSMPSHRRKFEFRKRRMFRKAEAKRTLPIRIKAEEKRKEKLKKQQEKN